MGFAALYGQHGLIRLVQIEAQEKQLQEELPGQPTQVIAAKRAGCRPNGPISTCSMKAGARRVLGWSNLDELLDPPSARAIRFLAGTRGCQYLR